MHIALISYCLRYTEQKQNIEQRCINSYVNWASLPFFPKTNLITNTSSYMSVAVTSNPTIQFTAVIKPVTYTTPRFMEVSISKSTSMVDKKSRPAVKVVLIVKADLRVSTTAKNCRYV